MKKRITVTMLASLLLLLASCGSSKSSGGCGGKTCPLGGVKENETSLKSRY